MKVLAANIEFAVLSMVLVIVVGMNAVVVGMNAVVVGAVKLLLVHFILTFID